MVDRGFIMDVGMHTGDDTRFYLAKGFRVLAVEANPALVRQCQQEFASEIEDGRLEILQCAIDDEEGTRSFHVNLKNDQWGTLSAGFARRNEKFGAANELIEVPCMRFDSVLERYGVPYYLKIDIEGRDNLCLAALHRIASKPDFVSFETSGTGSFEETFEGLSHLYVAGYRKFKLVNQETLGNVTLPDPPLEGRHVDARFTGATSGPFGEETPGKWVDIEQLVNQYQKVLRLQSIFSMHGRFAGTAVPKLYWNFKKRFGGDMVGWYDVHAKWG